MRKPILGAVFFTGVLAAQAPLGIFEDHADIGTVLHAGSAEFDSAKRAYTLSGSGDNMWAASDAFHFAWKKMSGDVMIAADLQILGTAGDPHRKAVLMIRQSLDFDSAYVDAALHGSGLTSMQTRDIKGGPSYEIQSNVNAPRRLRLTKRGDAFYLSVAKDGGDFQFSGGSLSVPMNGPFYVGLAVCAHNKDNVEKAAFTGVEIGTPSAASVAYSTIEAVPVPTGDRRAVYASQGRIDSPSWSADSLTIQFSRGGKTWRVAATGEPGEATEAGAARPPAKGAAAHFTSDRNGVMQVWRKRPDGAGEEALTPEDHTAWFPQVSPDGLHIAFLSAAKAQKQEPENQLVMLRIVTIAGKSLRDSAKFIGGKGSFDGSPWSPDGRRVAYVSYQQVPADNVARK